MDPNSGTDVDPDPGTDVDHNPGTDVDPNRGTDVDHREVLMASRRMSTMCGIGTSSERLKCVALGIGTLK